MFYVILQPSTDNVEWTLYNTRKIIGYNTLGHSHLKLGDYDLVKSSDLNFLVHIEW